MAMLRYAPAGESPAIRREQRARSVCRRVQLALAGMRMAPALAVVHRSPRREVIEADLHRWMQIRGMRTSPAEGMRLLMARAPEFRSLVYWRLGLPGSLVSRLYPGLPSLHLNMDPRDVGPGLYIQHGEGTYMGCRKIGRNAWINQGVTLGFTNADDCPTLGDDVIVSAGAKVLGRVELGDGVHVGANAVVLRDVPAGAVVAPPTARIVRP